MTPTASSCGPLQPKSRRVLFSAHAYGRFAQYFTAVQIVENTIRGMMPEVFTQSQLQAIADALGDTSDGLSGSEIGHLLNSCRMDDPSPAMTKRHRLYNAFVESQNKRQDRLAILAFIRKSVKPELYVREPQRYEPMRAILNLALAFAGPAVD